MKPFEDLPERLSKRIVSVDDCWQWDNPDSEGYGRVTFSGTQYLAHRVVYENLVGPIPAGLHIDHLCRNRGCVNPDHLDPVTCRVNVMRSPIAIGAVNARKTHCKRGHEFTAENTYVLPEGGRHCRECWKINNREFKRRSRKSQHVCRRCGLPVGPSLNGWRHNSGRVKSCGLPPDPVKRSTALEANDE
jgi:hypothetical protein